MIMKKSKKIKVLIAEDDFLVAQEISNALKKIGYENIGTATNGEKSVEMAISLKPDVVLMDIKMPELDGFEATRQIQERCKIPVVVLTAYESEEFLEKASNLGIYAYIIKPPVANEIERNISIALARYNDLMKLDRLNKDLKTEIEKRKQTEKELSESRDRLDLAVTGTNLGLWDWNIKTGEAVYNKQWAEMLGYTLYEIEPNADSWKELVHPDDAPKMINKLNEHVRKKTPFYEVEFRMKTKTGKWKWVYSAGKVFEWDNDGKPLRMTGTNRGITERKQAEQELKNKNTELETFNKLAVDRELRMIELKREINELLKKLGQQERYKIVE